MIPKITTWINGYLDETLTLDEMQQLNGWLAENPDHARHFAAAVMLHDRLRGELFADTSLPDVTSAEHESIALAYPRPAAQSPLRRRSYRAALVVACAMGVAVLFWKSLGENRATASSTELHRIIAASAELIDHTYQINMENEDPNIRAGKMPRDPGHGPRPNGRGPGEPRPPRGKPGEPPPPPSPPPPMDGARLYVRGGRQFVLVRTGLDGRQHITGCNGESSWAVMPDGPVRVSSDMNRYRRGIPGQKQAVPLVSIHEGLEGLLSSYLITTEPGPIVIRGEPCQRLIAERRSSLHRGPRRVEITYSMRTGRIQDMVFVDLPRDQQLPVIIHLQLIEERDLGAEFFEHRKHHEPGRPVEYDD